MCRFGHLHKRKDVSTQDNMDCIEELDTVRAALERLSIMYFQSGVTKVIAAA